VSRISISQLIVALQDGAPLRDALASALRDDELRVLYWLERRQGTSRGGWVDPHGQAAAEPTPGNGRAVKLVEHEGTRIAAIEYDTALDDETELLNAVTAAAGLALRNDRLQAELRAEVGFWDTVTDTVPSLLATIDTEGVIRNLNAAAVEVAGYSAKDEAIGRDYWDVFIDPAERSAVIERFGELAPDFPEGEYENTFVNARGERRVVSWRTAPIRDENGAVTAIVSGGVDITLRRERERELERERDVQTTVFEAMPSIMVALAPDGTIRDRDADDPSVGANHAFRRAVRWPDEDLVGRPFLDIVVEDDDGRAARAIAAAATGETSAEVESAILSANGSSRVFAWSAIPIADVTERMNRLVLVCGTDITERKHADEELRASRTRLVRAEETARRTLERNLHDGAQQRLVALSVALRLVESRMSSDLEAALELLTGAQTELAQALAELRELARGIHPAVLTDRGLRPALETLVARSPVPVELVVPEERLAADVEAAAYYVVAESLTNVARYAHASSAEVAVRLDGDVVVVLVSDNGVGGADPGQGSGLRGLADRVGVLEGTLAVESPRGKGTSVRAEIPLSG
jgi:PAS domain S-box-containing protein